MSKLNLRQAREKAGVSVEFVAEQMGVSVQEQNLERYFTPEYPQRKKNSLTL